jgi:hypothetical protein
MTTEPARSGYWNRLLAVACPQCGAGQHEGCISRTGQTRYPARDSHSSRMEAAKRAGLFGGPGGAAKDGD